MIYLLQAVALLAWTAVGFLLLSSQFLLETRLLLGGVYLLVAVNAAIGAAVLWDLRTRGTS